MRSAPSPRAACLSLVCAVAALVAVSPAASAATYHVTPQGSDSAAGTSALPFRTISRAASAARQGDTVLVESGRYPETVTVGSTGSGVTFRGEGPTRPVIDGEGKRAIGLTTNAHDVTVENFEISGQKQFGLYMRGKSNRVAGNLVHHIGAMAVNAASGIRVANGGGSVIADNTVHDVGPGGESMGIYLLQVRDTVVKGNTVYLVRKEGVRDFRGLDNTIRDNRLYLNWTGVSLNYSTGSTVVNNYIYDNTEGIDAKHDSYASVLSIWQLATPHWDRIWHNTIYRSTGISIGIGLGGDPFDYLDVRDNIFSDAAYSHIRDVPEIRGQHVVMDGNAYEYGPGHRTKWIYKNGWSGDATLSGIGWATFRSQLGWEANGSVMDPGLIAPEQGNLDYAATSPAAKGGLPLGDAFGNQLGARGLTPAPVRWMPYPMKAIDSSSKGTWSTSQHLQETVDDNQWTYWVTATNADEYVTYDFGQQRTFDHLVLTIFSHFDNRNPRGYQFEVSDDAVHWRTALQGVNPDSEGSSYKYELPQPATARYLRFTMKDTFCTSYTPRTSCGGYFVLSDLKAGSLIGPDAQPITPGGAGVATTALTRGTRPEAGVGSVGGGRNHRSAPRTQLLGPVRMTAGGKLRLRVRCDGDGAECVGAVRIRTSKRRGHAARAIARRAFRLAPRRQKTLKLRLRRSAVRSLRRHGADRLAVTLVTRGARPRTRVVRLRFSRR